MTSTRRSARGATLTARLHQQELTVQAVVTGERELAVQALVLDPFVPDSRTAHSVLDDAIATNPAGAQAVCLMKASGNDAKVVALDVGGTAMKGAVLNKDGCVAEFYRWPTPRSAGADAVVGAVLEAVEELLRHADGAAAIGLVVPGLVDDRTGIAIYSENIKWRDVPFRELVAERTGLPVGFGHDVRAGGLAERTIGAARGEDDVLFMPIGTGISGAMYIAGRLVEDKYAGEIGHINVGAGEPCACGARGCLEAVASGASITRRYNRATGMSVAGAREVLELVATGDRAAAKVWDEALDGLARALATYTSLLAPKRIVIGGGLACAGEALLEPLRRRLRELLVWQQEPQIVAALLADNAACLGAGLLARQAIAPTAARQEQEHH
jgi:glucokinase